MLGHVGRSLTKCHGETWVSLTGTHAWQNYALARQVWRGSSVTHLGDRYDERWRGVCPIASATPPSLGISFLSASTTPTSSYTTAKCSEVQLTTTVCFSNIHGKISNRLIWTKTRTMPRAYRLWKARGGLKLKWPRLPFRMDFKASLGVYWCNRLWICKPRFLNCRNSLESLYLYCQYCFCTRELVALCLLGHFWRAWCRLTSIWIGHLIVKAMRHSKTKKNFSITKTDHSSHGFMVGNSISRERG